ncbi:MAG: hypothetical protein V4710_00300 [Verrucomicrobiota bacterium]
MNVPILVILLFGFLTSLRAEESSYGRRWVASPDHRYLLTFISEDEAHPQVFTIQDAHGKTLLTSLDYPELHGVFTYATDRVLWSPDSQVVAVAAGSPHFMVTYIFARSGDTFVLVPAPGLAKDFANYFILPVKWLKNRTLHVEISGPYGGKADKREYRGEARLKVTLNPLKCEKRFEHIQYKP